MSTPAIDWRDAIPCGNGSLCALVYGSISPDTILFNHDQLWYKGNVQPLPEMDGALEEVRRLLDKGDMKAAHKCYEKRFRAAGFDPEYPIYHPAFDLILRPDTKSAFRDYTRTLSFETGEATVSYKDGENPVKRRFFISRADGIGVLHVKSRDPLDFAMQLREHGDPIVSINDIPLKFTSRSERGMLALQASGSDGGYYGAVLRIVSGGSAFFSTEDGLDERPAQGQRETARLSGIRELTAIIGMYVNAEDAESSLQNLMDRLEAVDADYDALLERNKATHGILFNRLRFTLGDNGSGMSNEALLLEAYGRTAPEELIVRQFDYGRYLLLCCSSEDSLPLTLQGSYNGEYYPPWHSIMVHNENTQMFYWQALPGRIPETMQAVFNHFENHLEEYKENARKLFDCRGIFISLVGADHTGLVQVPWPHCTHFNGVAAWISAMYHDHWRYTGDMEFLRLRALPFMREAAMFYEDYLTVGDDGYAKIYPSNSPENAPANTFAQENGCNEMNPGYVATINATIEIALVKELFNNLLNAYDVLKLDGDETGVWQEWLAKMPPYRINEDGAMAEWIDKRHVDNYAHRHLSHIYPFFPGHELAGEAGLWRDAIRKAVDKRMEIGMTAQTGWPLTHLANVYARLGDGNKALECLDILYSSCIGKNLFTYHNDYRNMGLTLRLILNGYAPHFRHKCDTTYLTVGGYPPFQIDANMGFTSAVLEMLVNCYKGTVSIFPALPDRWRKGGLSGVGLEYGAELDLSWDKEANCCNIIFSAKRTCSFHIELPDDMLLDGSHDITLPPDIPVRIEVSWRQTNV